MVKKKQLGKRSNSATRLITELKLLVKEGNRLLIKRDSISLKRNKFQSKNKFGARNPLDKKLNKVADDFAVTLNGIRILEQKLKDHEDWELYQPMYSHIMAKQFLLTNHITHESNKNPVQHKPARRKTNLARSNGRKRVSRR